MMRHTPGQWTVEYTGCSDSDAFDIETATIRADGIVVAEVECHHESIANVEANAKLIAAAPEMAETLRSIAESAWNAGDMDTVRETARAALAKAAL